MAYKNYGKPSNEDALGSETQAWNSADIFSKLKISRILVQLDLDEEIALFGRKDEQEDISEQLIPHRRVEYLQKFIFHIRQLMGNCKFAIDRGGYDEKTIKHLDDRLEQVEMVMDGIASNFVNEVTKEEELRINEKHFKTCFNILQMVKDELNFVLNRASLIFRQGNELDLDAVMRGIEDGS